VQRKALHVVDRSFHAQLSWIVRAMICS
jgi:hypothetical protein